MTQNVIENLFSIPVYLSDGYTLDANNKDALIKYATNNQSRNTSGNIITTDHYILDIPYLSDLKKYLLEQISKYAHEVLCIIKNIDVYITQSWLNINPTNTSHHFHSHPNSFISGTYYFQGNTPISFKHDHRNIFQNFAFDFTEINTYNSNICNIKIQEGRCLLFPSTLHHFVENNNDKEERISLSFNTFIKGRLTTFSSAQLTLGEK
tara:strand:- start:265 stop:888 length:624 start_codon:yes stop_codon:yes gene_type:complete